jgi:riboflavin kinase/FMN adenylyltransferase
MTRNIEANIFDFEQDLYGKTIRLHFIDYIRGDVKFDSLEALRLQIEKDKEVALKLLS